MDSRDGARPSADPARKTAVKAQHGAHDFAEQASATLSEALEAFAQWQEEWQGASGRGYSGAEDALLAVDAILRRFETLRERWRQMNPPSEQSATHAEAASALDEVIERLGELVAALDERDFERMRVLSQTVDLSGQRLRELEDELAGR